MGGLGGPRSLDRSIETALRRDRLIVGLSLTVVVALAWYYLWRGAAAMHTAGGAGMRMPAMDPAGLALSFLMWIVMMAGMMLPSAAPTVLLYGAMVRKNAEHGVVLPAVSIFVGGYLIVWAGFSLAAALLQAALEHAALLTPMMASASKPLSGALLVAAGIYQLTPLKDVCLGKCRNPVQFLMSHWRSSPSGALRMGVAHGGYCLGCCWTLMLLLFVVGVMNLAWVALIAAFVLVEKLFPAGRLVSRLSGAALILIGLAVLASFA